jgi:anti-sigma B factor antagonist
MSDQPAPPFSVDVAQRDGATTVRISGELDVATRPELEDAIQRARVRPGGRCTLDLRGVSFMDSMGISLLMRLDAAARADGWTLVIIRPAPGPALRVMDLCRVADRITVVDEPAGPA